MKKYNSEMKILLIFLLAIFLTSTVYIIYYFKISHINKDSNVEIADKFEEITIDNEEVLEERNENILKIEELQKENPDVIGWIKIEGSNINYPVLQTSDNEFYLTHNYKKEYVQSGSIFLDKDVQITKPSTNFLIYGHRNIKGEMFEELAKYKKEKYYKEHPIIKFTTINDEYEYEIIAVFLSRVYYKKETDVFRYYNFINAKDEEEYNYYVSNSKKEALYDTGKTAKYGEQLLTLSTCEYSQIDGRLVIVAKKVMPKA